MKINLKFVCRYFSKNFIDITPEVKNALNNQKPVIALESALITHGLPYPKNVETALEMEHIIKSYGIIPATIGVINGKVKAGMVSEQIYELGIPAEKKTLKVSRRDFPYVLSQGLNGGTTVSGTLVIASALGIKFFVTGGIGGVHLDGQNSLDISADLLELSRCAIMVVSAGVKSILDIGRTLEYLETVGVCVASYNSKREFPAFYTKQSGYYTVCDVTSPYEAAGLLEQCQNTGSGVLLAVPIPKEKIKKSEIDLAIKNALQMCVEKSIKGKNVTPFVLSEVSRVTKGVSMETNISLLKNNCLVGSKIAKEFYSRHFPKSESIFEIKNTTKKASNFPVVIGGSNLDYVLQVDEDLKTIGKRQDHDTRIIGYV
ncbi:Pseudouridine-5'-phosphate glycosidase [Cinara cedri]|uniref:Pseudouridine-5'-phosphate glycosidase n=1 Tax=Cinara cedri TaxID=506608 RepID=A0A5E4MFW5_9HEMI|nr:Pseudouridine-5'-phosphate glycosidase [Cinara cedri]